jgi:RHS repeat-associated protein
MGRSPKRCRAVAHSATNALPTYQAAYQYTDADQLSTTTTSTINSQGQSTPGYSTFQNYDANTGVPIGLSTQTSSTPNLAALTDNTSGLVSGLAFQNGAGTEQAAEAFSYDGDLRPSEDTATWQSGSGQSGQFFDETRSFDQASNLVSQTTTMAAVTGLNSTAGSETNDYCYDEQNRLIWASNNQQPSPSGAESCGSATATQDDAWGNVTSRTYNQQTATLSYNKLDEMVEWQIPNTNQAWYAYDSSGERTLQRSTIGTTTTMTIYAFGLEEYDYDGSGNLTSSTHYYTLGGRLIGELQQSGSTSTTNYFLTDNLGSVMAAFNSVSSNAALLSTQLYAPYGASRFSAGTPSNYTNKGYTGQYNDTVSGLDYYNARYYDPVSGVFLSADTVEGNDSGMNPYAYAGSNPATYNDPSGERYSECLQSQCDGPTATDTADPPVTSTQGQGNPWDNIPTPIKIVIAVGLGFLGITYITRTGTPSSQSGGPQPSAAPTPTAALIPTDGTSLSSPVYHDAATPSSPFASPVYHDQPTPTPPTHTGSGKGGGKKPPTKPTASPPDEPHHHERPSSHPNAQAAFDYIMQEMGGPLDDNAEPTFVRPMGGNDDVAGLQNGYQDNIRSWRLDWDANPKKGLHFNWMLGKRFDDMYGYASFPGTYDTYQNMLLGLAEGGIQMMLEMWGP